MSKKNAKKASTKKRDDDALIEAAPNMYMALCDLADLIHIARLNSKATKQVRVDQLGHHLPTALKSLYTALALAEGREPNPKRSRK
jgi:hypothetical protein